MIMMDLKQTLAVVIRTSTLNIFYRAALCHCTEVMYDHYFRQLLTHLIVLRRLERISRFELEHGLQSTYALDPR